MSLDMIDSVGTGVKVGLTAAKGVGVGPLGLVAWGGVVAAATGAGAAIWVGSGATVDDAPQETINTAPNSNTAKPESTEGGRRVSVLKWPKGAPLNLG